MNDAIMSMMTRYDCKSSEDYENALKEIVQEVALVGLSRSGFFTQASFYGGTALRIFHGLRRFSEDMDFSLDNAVVKIKFEIDTHPPLGASYQYLNAINPTPYRARLYDLPSLFAGKTHAVLCRDYKNRVKGRDFYDYVWYLQKGCQINLFHLQKRLEQSGKWDVREELTLEKLKTMLIDRFEKIDYDSARADVEVFLNEHDREGLSVWDAEFFSDITDKYLR